MSLLIDFYKSKKHHQVSTFLYKCFIVLVLYLHRYKYLYNDYKFVYLQKQQMAAKVI